jgi:HD-GYP domain-containing protein (c-di-GMP phosphodiesterase class II)
MKGIVFPWPIAEIIYQHHEQMDGTGYPRGLKGDEILLEARIIAVADTLEAMSAYRPYRPALGLKAALDELARKRGTSYDARVVDACQAVFANKTEIGGD